MSIRSQILSLGNLVDSYQSGDIPDPKFTLNSLEEGKVGLLLAAPGKGKSHLVFSIALEHASTLPLLGVSACPEPRKTLILSSEDGLPIIAKRFVKKLANIDPTVVEDMRTNLDIVYFDQPLVVPPDASSETKANHISLMKELSSLFSDYSLVIIDTVSESIGECDEQQHDRHIKNTFSKLGKESNASILLVHHVNKAEIKGVNEISQASGAGLTTLMRLCKLILGIVPEKNKLLLRYLRSNHPVGDTDDIELSFNGELTMNRNGPRFCGAISDNVTSAKADEVDNLDVVQENIEETRADNDNNTQPVVEIPNEIKPKSTEVRRRKSRPKTPIEVDGSEPTAEDETYAPYKVVLG